MTNQHILLFNKSCLYHETKEETILYGQFKTKFDSVLIDDTAFELVFCKDICDFYIKLKGKVYNLKTIVFLAKSNELLRFQDIHLNFPFEDCDLQLSSKSAIITTLCKDYSHRLDEWIEYNLRLGFSGIVIFNNDGNMLSQLNEPTENCVRTCSMEEICKKYKKKVWMIDFPYAPFHGRHWNNIQRVTLNIGVNAFRNKCRHIALIDADEFIYLPKNKSMNIEDFLQEHGTITIGSNILTNKNENDILHNNILQLARYVGENKYTKTILHTEKLTENECIITPHEHRSQIKLNKNDILHYHCWMNKRYTYNEKMPFIDLLA